MFQSHSSDRVLKRAKMAFVLVSILLLRPSLGQVVNQGSSCGIHQEIKLIQNYVEEPDTFDPALGCTMVQGPPDLMMKYSSEIEEATPGTTEKLHFFRVYILV